ncbi:hypothetical protein ACWD00_24905 [Streptomyces viridiviolaceus]
MRRRDRSREEPPKSPVVFARLLTHFDEQPDIFDERLRHLLFWRFKWAANALRAPAD